MYSGFAFLGLVFHFFVLLVAIFIIIRLATKATKTLNMLENIYNAQNKQIVLLHRLIDEKTKTMP